MQERIKGIYDSIITAHDTRKNLEDNKDQILPFEMVISTDSNDLLFKDEQGNLRGFFGSSGDINDQIKEQVDNNTIGVQSNFEAIGVNTKQINDLKHDKLDKGLYAGNAENLNIDIVSNKNKIEELKMGKLDKGVFTGTADDLIDRINNIGSNKKASVISNIFTPVGEGTTRFLKIATVRNLGQYGNKVVFKLYCAGTYSTNANQNEVPMSECSILLHSGNADPIGYSLAVTSTDGKYTGVQRVRGHKDPNDDTYEIFIQLNSYSGVSLIEATGTIPMENITFHNDLRDESAGSAGTYEGVVARHFTTDNNPISKEENGWCKLANGMIVQWGHVTVDVTTWKTGTSENPRPRITFPISFTGTPSVSLNPGNFAWCLIAGVEGADSSGFYIYGAKNVESIVMTTTNKFNWIAIGY